MVLCGLSGQAWAAAGLEEAALAVPAERRGATLFALMPAGRTGVVAENNYADPRMWKDRFQEFKFGAMGTGVAVGDYDGDGRPDIFVVSKTEQSRLFRNLGGWKFADVTAQAGINEPGKPGAWTQGAAFADVNNDGKLDLYLCRFGAPNQLFMNQGNGTFKEEAAARGLAVVDASGMGAFCDYDRDGWLDVYVQTNLLDAVKAPNGQADYLFHNRGDGTFENVTARAGIRGETMGHSAAWWDYDGDGWPDLYVANDFATPDSLYRNNRDGTFTNVLNQAVTQTPHSSMGSDQGDVDNDGRLDLLVADMATSTREKDQRGTAKIRALLDSTIEQPGTAMQYMRSMLYLGTGTGWLREGAYLAGVAATDWTWSPRFEDFDNDGRLDLYVTNGMVRELHNADMVQDISASESLEAGLRVEQAAPVFAERNLAYRNEGDLRFREVGAEWGLDQVGVSFGAATGDFDGDGDLDLVYGNYQAAPTLLRNDSSGHRVIVALRGTSSNRFGVGATVRIESALGQQVRTLVLARGYLSTSEPVLHFGLGEDTVIKSLTVEWPSGQRQTFANLAVDRKLTITEPNGPATTVAPPKPAARYEPFPIDLQAHEQLESDANPQALVPERFDRRGPALAVGDLNGDGREELLLGGTTKDPLKGFMADSLDDGPLLVFEANGDSRPDLLQTKAGTSRPFGPDYQPKLHLGTSNGFTPAPLPAVPQSTGAVAAADFDRDGDLDVFLGARVLPGKYPLSPRSSLLRNNAGSFTELTLPQNGELGLVTSALWSDLDLDGWPDLIVALEWGHVLYLHNDEGRGFTDRSAAHGFTATGFWSSLATADFNQDGRPDYAVGNLGLNTPYRSGPAILYYGRFGDGGPPQLIETLEENNQLYPRRSRNELGARIPGLLRRYPRHNDYAKATLPEILGEARLAHAQRFDASELRSGVYLSQPDGRYRFEPMPWPAQLAPVEGLVALDHNGDGRPDLALVQNSYAATPSLGRFTGGLGLILTNDGQGRFTALDPAASGLIVPGDAKALVITDLDQDGWPDLVASRNDQPALAFRHRGLPGQRPLRVNLQGPAGNPTSVGARLTLTLADGSTQTTVVAAGSGYYSQSSPASFFNYPSAQPPRLLTIVWPDGATTTHPFTSPPPSGLTISVGTH